MYRQVHHERIRIKRFVAREPFRICEMVFLKPSISIYRNNNEFIKYSSVLEWSERLIPLMILITASAAYVVYSLFLTLVGQPIQPHLTGVAIGTLFTCSYYISTGRLPFWSEGEEV